MVFDDLRSCLSSGDTPSHPSRLIGGVHFPPALPTTEPERTNRRRDNHERHRRHRRRRRPPAWCAPRPVFSTPRLPFSLHGAREASRTLRTYEWLSRTYGLTVEREHLRWMIRTGPRAQAHGSLHGSVSLSVSRGPGRTPSSSVCIHAEASLSALLTEKPAASTATALRRDTAHAPRFVWVR